MDTGSTPLEEVKKDEEIWFDDGNIVIIAADTAFRLYKGLLSSVSPAFADLFTVPLPADAEIMDGCFVVRLSDSPVDLRHSLGMLTRPRHELFRHDYMIPFDVLAGIIRVGHKYQVDSAIIDAAASRLEEFFTGILTTIKENPRTDDDSEVHDWNFFFRKHQSRCGLAFDTKDAIAVVDIARLLERPQMLPFALYLCCLGGLLYLLNGTPRPFGCQAVLSDEDYCLCVEAIFKIRQQCHQMFREVLMSRLTLYETRIKECASNEECKKAMSMIAMRHGSKIFNEDPTELFDRLFKRRVKMKQCSLFWNRLCSSCVECLYSRYDVLMISEGWIQIEKFFLSKLL